jgi:hypothetical protein
MRRIVSVAGILVFVAATSVLAAQVAPAQKAAKSQAKVEKTEKATKPAVHSVTGTVEKLDNNVLTVTTKKGAENFSLTPETVVMEGAKKVETSALKGGEMVKVTYHDMGGTMMATRVAVSRPASRSQARKSGK